MKIFFEGRKEIVSLYKGASDTSAQFGNGKRLNAYDYWLRELSIKDERTIYQYRHYFDQYLSFLNTTSDKLIEHRQTTINNEDIKIQRTHESYFLDFLKHLKDKGYSNGTLQVAHASVRSFYEMHYIPLRTRRKDYPKSTPNGTRRATTPLTIKMLEQYKPQNKTTFKALVMTLKDTGLRVTDLMNLNCNTILENWNKTLIPFTVVTEKTGYLAKTFIGSDAITALKEYIQDRRNGSRKRKPENITKDSPLFVNWKNRKRMTRQNASTIIRNAFLKIGERKLSPHSFRKKLQTDLEKAGMPTNWIDQVLGHQLINSRDAYSLPTDQELQEAYKKTYPTIQLIPTKQQEQTEFAEAKTLEECKQLLAKGYKFEMNHNGTSLFSKPANTQNRY